jgi:hypothetical protein
MNTSTDRIEKQPGEPFTCILPSRALPPPISTSYVFPNARRQQGS